MHSSAEHSRHLTALTYMLIVLNWKFWYKQRTAAVDSDEICLIHKWQFVLWDQKAKRVRLFATFCSRHVNNVTSMMSLFEWMKKKILIDILACAFYSLLQAALDSFYDYHRSLDFWAKHFLFLFTSRFHSTQFVSCLSDWTCRVGCCQTISHYISM